MTRVRSARYVALCLLSALLVVCGGTPAQALVMGSSTPLPAAGTVTQINAQIQTNLTILATGTTTPLSVLSVAHAKCETEAAVFNSSTGVWQFTNTFQVLQATFNSTPLGTVVITMNPNLPITGTHVTTSSQPTFPVNSTIQLYLQVSVLGQTLVNADPVVLQGSINAWPQVGATYQATSGTINLYAADPSGNPTGPAVAQIFGTQVSVVSGQTLSPSPAPPAQPSGSPSRKKSNS
jgi:hypothetical protein